MVGVPKCLIGLFANAGVGSSVHHEHAKKHDMACDAACLGIVYLYCCLRSYLISLHVEEAGYISKRPAEALGVPTLHNASRHGSWSRKVTSKRLADETIVIRLRVAI